MIVIYCILLVGMVFGILMLLKRQNINATLKHSENLKEIDNAAHTNDGGNSHRAENSNKAGSIGQSDYGMNSMGADNDDDKYNKSGNSSRKKADYDNYER